MRTVVLNVTMWNKFIIIYTISKLFTYTKEKLHKDSNINTAIQTKKTTWKEKNYLVHIYILALTGSSVLTPKQSPGNWKQKQLKFAWNQQLIHFPSWKNKFSPQKHGAVTFLAQSLTHDLQIPFFSQAHDSNNYSATTDYQVHMFWLFTTWFTFPLADKLFQQR